MFKRILLFGFVMLLGLVLSAQAPQKRERETVDRLMMDKNYSEAMIVVKEMLNKYPKDQEFNLMLGVCLFNTDNDVTKAIAQLEKTHAMTKSRKLLIEVKNTLATAYHIDMQFDKAIEMYNSINEDVNSRNNRRKEEIKLLISRCKYAKEVCAKPLNIEFVSLGSNVNTIYDEHTPCLSADERFMLFTSRAKADSDVKALDGKYLENIYYSLSDGKNWNKSKLISNNSSEGHMASVSISFDGRTMLLFKSNIESRDNAGGDFYTSKRTGYEWSEPVKLGENINSPYRETHAALSVDGNVLYFSSDRPGGKGGFDLYKSVKDKDGKWGIAVNLGDVVNDKYDQMSPYIHVDGKTLYFSSNGGNTIGGFDIFSSILKGDKWTSPMNLGYPINSTRDDIYYNLTVDGKRAYMASRRVGGEGLLDLYMIKLKDVQSNKIFIVTGKIGDKNAYLPRDGYKLTVKTLNEKDFIVEPDPVTGEFLFPIDADKIYRVDYSKEAYETLNTELMFPSVYYNDINHGVMPLNLISLCKKNKRYVQGDLTANIAACGFANPKKSIFLPNIEGKKGILKILNISVTYTVQIKAMKRALPLSYFNPVRKGVAAVRGKDKITRYLYRYFIELNEAAAVMKVFRDMGYYDAFIREYQDGIPTRILDNDELMLINTPIKHNKRSLKKPRKK